ncbi:MAG: hypothetical protein FE834_06915 [Gammaproteobacteria bacterium]|nr:hypothetical protein [Gammaproteobacteria bacterium]
MNNKFPIYRDAYALVVAIKQVVQRFGRYHKYTLGSELQHNVYLLLEYIVFAINSKTKRLDWINQAHLNSEHLKIKIQLAKILNLYSPSTWTANCNNTLKQRQIAQIFITN